jgi:hypothetical protein
VRAHVPQERETIHRRRRAIEQDERWRVGHLTPGILADSKEVVARRAAIRERADWVGDVALPECAHSEAY